MHLVCNHFKHCTPLCFVLISIYQTLQDCGLVSDPPYSGGGERVQWRRGPVHTGTVEEQFFQGRSSVCSAIFVLGGMYCLPEFFLGVGNYIGVQLLLRRLQENFRNR